MSDDTLNAIKLIEQRRLYERRRFFKPVPKQLELLNSRKLETMLAAGTAAGKTETAAYKWSRHLTGVYPKWWAGKRSTRPITVWCLGLSGKEIARGPQIKMLGTDDIRITPKLGMGMVEKEFLSGEPSASRNHVGGCDTFHVKHHTDGREDGISSFVFVTNDQGRAALQAAQTDGLWCDEEPDLDVYIEAAARGIRTPDFLGIDVTFTPLMGETPLYRRLRYPPPERQKDVLFINMTLYECDWYTKPPFEPGHLDTMIALYPEHERPARVFGVPIQGTGMVWMTKEDTLRVGTIPLEYIPGHWRLIWGIDFGIAHAFAASLCAFDPDTDDFYVLRTLKIVGESAVVHARRMREICSLAPVAWPHDGHVREKGSGQVLADIYAGEGLRMLAGHAVDGDGSMSLHGTTREMGVWMSTNKFHVCECCVPWFDEYRSYHFDENGKIVAANDDVLSSSRYAWMMRRSAASVPVGSHAPRRNEPTMQPILDPWTGEPVQSETRQQALIRTPAFHDDRTPSRGWNLTTGFPL